MNVNDLKTTVPKDRGDTNQNFIRFKGGPMRYGEAEKGTECI